MGFENEQSVLQMSGGRGFQKGNTLKTLDPMVVRHTGRDSKMEAVVQRGNAVVDCIQGEE